MKRSYYSFRPWLRWLLPLPVLIWISKSRYRYSHVWYQDDVHQVTFSRRCDLRAGFNLRWDADRRAIKRWQAATGNLLVWPDHADLCVWLLKRLDALEGKSNGT